VLRQHGKPTSTARRGEHEILVYPKGGRVELVGGKVVDVKGPLPVPATTQSNPVNPLPDALGPNSTAESMTPPPAAPDRRAPHVKLAPPDEFNPGAMAQDLGSHVEKMDGPWGMAPPKPQHRTPLDSIPAFVTGLLLRFTFTVVALKLAFKYWEMDAFWTGVLLIAGIDMGLHAILELLGTATDGLTTILAVESGVPGLVMIYTVHRFCFNKRIQNAIITAAAVKFVVTFCYIFAGLAMLNLAFG
jgi:hypothetical protein